MFRCFHCRLWRIKYRLGFTYDPAWNRGVTWSFIKKIIPRWSFLFMYYPAIRIYLKTGRHNICRAQNQKTTICLGNLLEYSACQGWWAVLLNSRTRKLSHWKFSLYTQLVLRFCINGKISEDLPAGNVENILPIYETHLLQSVQSTIFFPFSANIYLFKVNRNSRKRCEICSKLTIKIQEQRHRRTFFTRFTSVNVSSVNFKDFE